MYWLGGGPPVLVTALESSSAMVLSYGPLRFPGCKHWKKPTAGMPSLRPGFSDFYSNLLVGGTVRHPTRY